MGKKESKRDTAHWMMEVVSSDLLSMPSASTIDRSMLRSDTDCVHEKKQNKKTESWKWKDIIVP